MPSLKGADRRVQPKAGALCAAYTAWRDSALKGETFVAWVGEDMQKICKPPEQRMTKEARQKYEAKRKQARADAKKNKTKVVYPPIPDPFKRVRPDIMALHEMLEHDDLRNLIDLKPVVNGKLVHYECTMCVQRNGLAGVRARNAEKFK